MSILEKFEGLQEGLEAINAVSRNPFDVTFDRVISPTEGVLDGRRTLLFGTNNYLGLTFDRNCIAAGVQALNQSGTGTTGSRIANGTYSGHTRLERSLARFYNKRSAMVFSTGYQANLGLISTLAGRGDHLLIDADSHASIYDASRLAAAEVIRFRHNDVEDLARRLHRLKGQPGERLIVVEGIYSMIGDAAPLQDIVAVKRENGAYLVVDEAHSFGVLGARGRGLCEAAGVEDDVDFVVGTFSKSLGSVGGFAVSNLPDFDILRVACRPYMFTASLPPSVIATCLAALERISAEPALCARVRENGGRLYKGLSEIGFDVGPMPNPIVAVSLPDRNVAQVFWNRLLEAGFYLNLALPPATPAGRSLLRLSVTASHTDEQIDQLITAFACIGAELGVISAVPARLLAPAAQ
jgi:8-amino-7-oxononanoate synthase